MNISIKAAKSNFFDRKAVLRGVGAARRRVLSKMGAFVRQRAKSSIRKHKKASKPGQPPSSHVGLLKQFLFFAYDESTDTVVVGPARLNKSGQAPSDLEYGGKTTIEERRFVSGAKYGNRKQRITVAKQITIRPRPFMGPALEAELPGFEGLWRDSIRS